MFSRSFPISFACAALLIAISSVGTSALPETRDPDIAAARAHAFVSGISARDIEDTEGANTFRAAPAPRVSLAEERVRQQRLFDRMRQASPSSTKPYRPAAPSDAIGGDDMFVTASQEIAFVPGSWSTDIAENGDIYVAVEVRDAVEGAEIRVYRSTDGGTEWSLWGTRGNADPAIDYHAPSLHVAEGTQNRVYVAYQFENGAADRTVNVAYSEANLAAATWSVRTVLSQAAVTFEVPDLSSDEVNQADYVLILVAHGDDGDGDDIWFTRSTDFGNTWDAEYRIGTRSSSTDDYRLPHVRYGSNGRFHCVWQYTSRAGAFDGAIRHRRALNEAAAGIADWEGIDAVTSTASGLHEEAPSVAASHGSDQVIIAFQRTTLASLVQTTQVRSSSDAGATWPAANVVDLDTYLEPITLALPGAGGFALVPWDLEDHGIQTAADATPLVWSPLQNFTDVAVNDGRAEYSVFDYDLTHGNRLGAIWGRFDVAPGQLDTVFFDGEWRRDPGYPNLEPGFPMALDHLPAGPPLITELDGDPQSEISYPDAAGFVNVINHDGTSLPGWPINVVDVPDDGVVAAGDLDGDGQNEIVVGDIIGRVHAWHGDGTALPNFPIDLGTGGHTYCSIGALLPGSNRQIVATSENGLYVLFADGSTAPGYPRVKPAFMLAPAAIGDIDNNGIVDVVTVMSNQVQSNNATGALGLNRSLPVGKTISNQPSLADLDLDGDLEIVVPTDQGDVYVMHHDGTDYAGWPYVDAGGDPITSVALSNLLGTGEPELAFSVNYRSFLKFHTGANAAGWPHNMVGGAPVTAAPTIEDLDGGSSDVLGASLYAYGWKNLNTYVPGWPRYLREVCEVSPASGDIDNDGDVEAIFLAPHYAYFFDMNAPVDRTSAGRVWPMYGYNAARTACLACGPDKVVSVPAGTVGGRLAFALLSSNPGRGETSFALELPGRAAVRLVVFNVAGRAVRTVVKSELPEGTHRLTWDGKDHAGQAVPAGAYYAWLSASGPGISETQVRKVVLVP